MTGDPEVILRQEPPPMGYAGPSLSTLIAELGLGLSQEIMMVVTSAYQMASLTSLFAPRPSTQCVRDLGFTLAGAKSLGAGESRQAQ